MQQHIYYIKFALRFADMQIPELVTVFNAQVQNRGWSSMRAYHNQALLDEFQHRGIDTYVILYYLSEMVFNHWIFIHDTCPSCYSFEEY